jgi:hypothetical protein
MSDLKWVDRPDCNGKWWLRDTDSPGERFALVVDDYLLINNTLDYQYAYVGPDEPSLPDARESAAPSFENQAQSWHKGYGCDLALDVDGSLRIRETREGNEQLEKINAFARTLGYGQGELDDDLVGCLKSSFDAQKEMTNAYANESMRLKKELEITKGVRNELSEAFMQEPGSATDEVPMESKQELIARDCDGVEVKVGDTVILVYTHRMPRELRDVKNTITRINIWPHGDCYICFNSQLEGWLANRFRKCEPPKVYEPGERAFEAWYRSANMLDQTRWNSFGTLRKHWAAVEAALKEANTTSEKEGT